MRLSRVGIEQALMVGEPQAVQVVYDRERRKFEILSRDKKDIDQEWTRFGSGELTAERDPPSGKVSTLPGIAEAALDRVDLAGAYVVARKRVGFATAPRFKRSKKYFSAQRSPSFCVGWRLPRKCRFMAMSCIQRCWMAVCNRWELCWKAAGEVGAYLALWFRGSGGLRVFIWSAGTLCAPAIDSGRQAERNAQNNHQFLQQRRENGGGRSRVL